MKDFKQNARGVAECIDVSRGEPVSDSQAGEGKTPERVACKNRETLAVLVVILRRVRIELDALPNQQGSLAGLVETEPAGEDSEASGDGPVKQIGLGKTEQEIALPVAEFGGKGERLAQSQEVIGLVAEPNKAAGDAADAASQADGLLTLFLDLERDVYCAVLKVSLDFGVLGFDRLEVIELVQPQDTDFPQAIVEQVAFVQQDFAPDHLVAGGDVALELYSADGELLLLVEFERQIDDLLLLIHIRDRLGDEVDVAILTVDLPVVLQGFTHFVHGEDVAFLERKNLLQELCFEEQPFVRVHVSHEQLAHAEPLALFYGDGDVGVLAALAPDDRHRHREAGAMDIHGIGDRVLDQHLEVAIVLIKPADAHLEVFGQLAAVVRFR